MIKLSLCLFGKNIIEVTLFFSVPRIMVLVVPSQAVHFDHLFLVVSARFFHCKVSNFFQVSKHFVGRYFWDCKIFCFSANFHTLSLASSDASWLNCYSDGCQMMVFQSYHSPTFISWYSSIKKRFLFSLLLVWTHKFLFYYVKLFHIWSVGDLASESFWHVFIILLRNFLLSSPKCSKFIVLFSLHPSLESTISPKTFSFF